jgi:hypothetical protein
VHETKTKIGKHFKVKDLGELKYCLGWQVDYQREKQYLKLYQKKHVVDDILKQYRMENSQNINTLLHCTSLLKKTIEGEIKTEDNRQLYRSIIGSLMYAMLGTRPIIATVVSTLSRCQPSPHSDHWKAAKRAIRYLNGTSNFGLILNLENSTDFILDGFADASHGSDPEDGKFVTAFVFLINETKFHGRVKNKVYLLHQL